MNFGLEELGEFSLLLAPAKPEIMDLNGSQR